MTKKRFTHKEDDWEILDRNKHFAYAHSSYQAEKIIQELNELVETNRELYQENKQLKKENQELKLLVQDWEALDEEKDEQLDKQNQALKKLKKENEQLKESVWSWSKSYNRVYEDNERILNTIKDAYYNERTQLGKSVLKQLLEAIQ